MDRITGNQGFQETTLEDISYYSNYLNDNLRGSNF